VRAQPIEHAGFTSRFPLSDAAAAEKVQVRKVMLECTDYRVYSPQRLH
jgi:hypothetical protein